MRHLVTIRTRATIGATAVVAAALVAAGIGLVSVVNRTMVDNLDTALDLRAADLAALIEAGTPPTSVAIADEEDAFVQLVALDGRILAASRNIEGEGVIVDAAPGSHFDLHDGPIASDAFRVHVARVDGPAAVTIIVGSTREPVDETLQAMTRALFIGVPLLVLFVAGTTWFVVGRALNPVEAIRAEVADIGESDLDRRVPQPGTSDEIGRLAVTMNDMLDRLEQAYRRQQRFVSDASHELRTPISTIRHELEVALRAAGAAGALDWPAIASDVLDEDLRMQRLVDDLLWLARHDQGRPDDAVEGRATLVDLDEVAFGEAQRTPSPRGIVVDTSGIGAGQVRGRRDDLRRVVRNLLDNARRHATARVAVAVAARDGQVHLCIDDDGPGIAPADRERVFERFTRLDEARDRDRGGTGLGLAIAAEIVRAHHGTITVADSPLGGARVEVVLPDARAG